MLKKGNLLFVRHGEYSPKMILLLAFLTERGYKIEYCQKLPLA